MHSFHHSRGRILFEVFCALAISASCFGAWTQTGAWALLPAAAVAALYGLVHAIDLRRHKSAKPVEPQRIAFEDEAQGDLLTYAPSAQEPVAANEPEAVEPAVEPEPVEQVAPRASRGRRTKAPRKGGACRSSADDEAKVTDRAPAEQVDVALPTPFDDAAHPNIEPLFEPEPFVRMPRPAFGRKAG